MNFDKESFKAEVRRRGCERVAKRKRIRKQITVCVIPLFVCVIAATVLVPRLRLGINEAKSADMLAENGHYKTEAAYGMEGDMSPEMFPPTGDVPGEGEDGDVYDEAPMPDNPNMEVGTEETEELPYQSLEIAIVGEDDSTRRYTDEQILFEFDAFYRSVIERDRSYTDKVVTGYRITLTMHDQSVQEFIWNGTSLYLPEEESTILLSDEERNVLTKLLLE